jgi:hypothetical protein
MRRFREDSRVVLDIRALTKVLPSKTSGSPEGVANWLLAESAAAAAAVNASARSSSVSAVGGDVAAEGPANAASAPALLSPVSVPAIADLPRVPPRLVIGAGKDYIGEQKLQPLN